MKAVMFSIPVKYLIFNIFPLQRDQMEKYLNAFMGDFQQLLSQVGVEKHYFVYKCENKLNWSNLWKKGC